MSHKKFFPTLERPDTGLDLVIINAHRFEPLTKKTLGKHYKKTVIKPFLCHRRGYVLHQGVFPVVMFDPETFDVRRSHLVFLDCDGPFEVWILENDKVTEYYDLGG